jgi:hypothetical protein
MNKKSLEIIRKIGISALILIVFSFLFIFPNFQPKEFDLRSTVDYALQLTMDSIPTATYYPTYTNLPTFTPLSTYTALPTYTSVFTYTPLPTHTARPTYTSVFTYTPFPTYTVRPTYTSAFTYTPLPTHTARPTYTSVFTYTPFPTQTPKPTYTMFPSLTPNPTYTPYIVERLVTPTTDSNILKAGKTDGFYLVGPEIIPGVWRTEEGKTKCYWKITDIKGNIISNYLGAGGGTIFIDENAFQIEILNCGTITYLETYTN